MRTFINIGPLLLLLSASLPAKAWFFVVPLPNVAKPPELQATIDALEKSTETRALAYCSEDKMFGAKSWVWGSFSGFVSQEEADRSALLKCEGALRAAKAKTAGGQPLYDFGKKICELHAFTPNDGPKIAEQKRIAAEEERNRQLDLEAARRTAVEEAMKRIAAEEEAKRVAAAEEEKRVALEEERKKVAGTDAVRKAVQEEAKHSADEESKRRHAEFEVSAKQGITRDEMAESAVPKQVDFNVEAHKAARILGCKPSGSKVTGVDAGNIQYLITCTDGKRLALSCDPTGLCLEKKSNPKSKR